MTCYERSRALAALKQYEDESRARPFADVSQECVDDMYEALREAVLALAAKHSPENDLSHALDRTKVMPVVSDWQTSGPQSFPGLAELVNRATTQKT